MPSVSFVYDPYFPRLTEVSDASPVYPGAGTQTASYNNLNQLTNLSGQALTWDANGNLLSDGQRDFSWDAENRLIKITYPNQSGKETDFAYDGLSRRTAISRTPAGGGSAVTTAYLWCGSRICQARNATDAVTREYYSEGELVPGSPAQPYYYGPDQIGSVRRAFASTTSAPAYSYDPYGNPLQTTAPVTDFNYAGMFYNADSGLYLTQYRAYDPVVGRWLSRDPLGESSDPAANLYRYADDNPITYVDPNGRQFVVGILAAAAFLAYEFTPQPANAPTGPCDVVQPESPLAPLENALTVSTPIEGEGIAAAEGTASAAGQIIFKTEHFASRLEAAGINVSEAKSAVSDAIAAMRENLAMEAPVSGRIAVDGTTVEYRAMLLPNGTVSVGTIFPVLP